MKKIIVVAILLLIASVQFAQEKPIFKKNSDSLAEKIYADYLILKVIPFETVRDSLVEVYEYELSLMTTFPRLAKYKSVQEAADTAVAKTRDLLDRFYQVNRLLDKTGFEGGSKTYEQDLKKESEAFLNEFYVIYMGYMYEVRKSMFQSKSSN